MYEISSVKTAMFIGIAIALAVALQFACAAWIPWTISIIECTFM